MIDHDHTKYAYHEGTRKLRAIADWISETTYTGAGPELDGREEVYDMLIELHQLLYSVTLYPLHEDDDFNDEVYDDGRPAISRIDLTGESPALPIPPTAYYDIGGEVPPFGCSIYVWRPGEADYPAEKPDLEHPPTWETTALMRHQGLLDWTRNAKGRIVKRPNQYGRLSPASSITEAGDGATNDYPRGAPPHKPGAFRRQGPRGLIETHPSALRCAKRAGMRWATSTAKCRRKARRRSPCIGLRREAVIGERGM